MVEGRVHVSGCPKAVPAHPLVAKRNIEGEGAPTESTSPAPPLPLLEDADATVAVCVVVAASAVQDRRGAPLHVNAAEPNTARRLSASTTLHTGRVAAAAGDTLGDSAHTGGNRAGEVAGSDGEEEGACGVGLLNPDRSGISTPAPAPAAASGSASSSDNAASGR